MPEPLNPDKISVAVIIGGHAYDVPAFKRLFDSFEDVVAYPQDISNFSRAWGVPPAAYDVLLFYNAGGDTAADLDATWGAGTSAAVEAVGQAEQGVVMLHHAIRSYMAWPKWSALLGIPHEQREGSEFTVEFGQTMRVSVTDPGHPVGRGIEPWDVVNEAWPTMAWTPKADATVIMTTDNEVTRTKTMAWCHHLDNARVFCLTPGHDNEAYSQPGYRTTLHRGIRWAAGRL
jgi:hypothetical protein